MNLGRKITKRVFITLLFDTMRLFAASLYGIVSFLIAMPLLYAGLGENNAVSLKATILTAFANCFLSFVHFFLAGLLDYYLVGKKRYCLEMLEMAENISE